MNDQEFIDRIQEKIERLTGRDIELRIDEEDAGQLRVDFDSDVPVVVMGRNVFEYSGFARLCTGIRRRLHPATARDTGDRVPDAAGQELVSGLCVMASTPIKNLSDYPRPWFYRPEIYYGFFIFPPAWSVLTLRSPWHNRTEGFRGNSHWRNRLVRHHRFGGAVRSLGAGGGCRQPVHIRPRPASHAGDADTVDSAPGPLRPTPIGGRRGATGARTGHHPFNGDRRSLGCWRAKGLRGR